jgi:hypothetical protein
MNDLTTAAAATLALGALVLPGCGALTERNEEAYRGHDAVELELNQHDLTLGMQRFPAWIVDDGEHGRRLFIAGLLTNRADNDGLIIDYTHGQPSDQDEGTGQIEGEVDARLLRLEAQIPVLVGEVVEGGRPLPGSAHPAAISCLLAPRAEYLDIRVRYIDPASGKGVEHVFPGCEVRWVNRHYSDRVARNLNYLWTVPIDIITWPFQFLYGIVVAHSDNDDERPE